MHTDISLPLDKMTFSEKMEVIDTIWADILRNPDDIEWPSWHEAYLNQTEEKIANGTAKFIDLETAEKNLLEQRL
ncbi:MAG: addiction module protein [Pyrinomonadaceae bacterium]